MSFESLSEKSAYLLGLIKGRGIDDEITTLVAEILNDMAHQVDDMGRDLDEISDLDEEIEFIAGDDDDEEYGDDDAEEEYYSMTCPNCSEQIEFEESVLEEGKIVCPACGTPIEISASLDDED